MDGVHVERDLPARLRRVDMEENLMLFGEFSNLHDWLNHADLIVCRHDANQSGLVRNRVPEIVEVDEAIGLDGHVGDAIPIFLQALTRVQHGPMFGDDRDEMSSLFTIHVGDAFNGQTV